jgi:hypothetical protein
VEEALEDFSHGTRVNKLCDPWVTTTMKSIFVDPNGFTCDVVPSENQVDVTINLPSISMVAHSGGYCDDHVLGVCVISLSVDVDTPLTISGMSVSFTITEGSILNGDEITPVFDPGNLTRGTPDNDSDVGCIGGFFLDALAFLAEIFTFGAFDPGPAAEAPVVTNDLSDELGLIEGDPFSLDLVQFDNEELPAFMLSLTNELDDVQITSNGIALSVLAAIEPTMYDPEVASVPGTPLTPAPLPQPPIAGGGDVTIALSEDFFNQVFSGMTQAGKLKTLFEDVRPLGDFFPADCTTLPTPAGRGVCFGITSTDPCLTLPGDEIVSCAAIRLLFGPKNIEATTPMILHGRVDVPPVLYLDDDAGTAGILETELRLNKISISLLADRDGDGVHEGTLESVPNCFGTNAPTGGECALWEACLNLNMFADMELGTGPGGKPAISTNITEFAHTLSSGVLCSGAVDPDSAGDETITTLAETSTIDLIEQMAGDSTPDLESEGLTFGGLVIFVNPRLIAIENDGNTDFQDYLAITGDLAPAP